MLFGKINCTIFSLLLMGCSDEIKENQSENSPSVETEQELVVGGEINRTNEIVFTYDFDLESKKIIKNGNIEIEYDFNQGIQDQDFNDFMNQLDESNVLKVSIEAAIKNHRSFRITKTKPNEGIVENNSVSVVETVEDQGQFKSIRGTGNSDIDIIGNNNVVIRGSTGVNDSGITKLNRVTMDKSSEKKSVVITNVSPDGATNTRIEIKN